MNLKLVRKEFRQDGIFSELYDESGNLIARTLEHAYEEPSLTLWTPKIPPGEYICRRGQHQLAHMTSPFTTFEIAGVAGHSNILFHCGNTQDDSEGCVLLGQSAVTGPDGRKMITASRVTFQKFMDLQQGVDQFTLTVVA